MNQLFKGDKGLAGGDHVIHDKHALALYHSDMLLREAEGLYVGCGDGLHLYGDGVGHIEFQRLAAGDIGLAGLSCHFIGNGDTLGLGSHDDIEIGAALQKLLGSFNGKLNIREHDESGDLEIIADGAEGQLAGEAGDFEGIGFH